MNPLVHMLFYRFLSLISSCGVGYDFQSYNLYGCFAIFILKVNSMLNENCGLAINIFLFTNVTPPSSCEAAVPSVVNFPTFLLVYHRFLYQRIQHPSKGSLPPLTTSLFACLA